MVETVVSIIVPCYNQALLLPEAIESLWTQSYSNWECIIVNDGSPDDTQRVAESYAQKDRRISVLNKPVNEGLSAARNSGIYASSGAFILPLDADDKLADTYLEKSLGVFQQQPEIKLVYTDAIKFGDEEGVVKRPEFDLRALCYQNIFQPCAMYRKSDFLETAGYRTNMRFGYEDWDFWFQLISKNEEVYHIHEPLFYGRIKHKSMITMLTQDASRERLMRQTIIENNTPQYLKWAPELISVRKSWLRRLIEKIAR